MLVVRICLAIQSALTRQNIHHLKCSCIFRYGFPLSSVKDPLFAPTHVNAEEAVDNTTSMNDIDTFDILAARGHSASYINKCSIACLGAFPANNDIKVQLSSPGLSHYTTLYVSKCSEDDKNSSGVGILAGLNYALTQELRRAEDDPDTNDAADLLLSDSRRRIIMSLMNSTDQTDVRTPMAVWNILYECNTMWSHAQFSPVYLTQDIAYLHDEPISATLNWDTTNGEQGSYTVSALCQDYVHRGTDLEQISRYEFAMWYTKVKRGKTFRKPNTNVEILRCPCDEVGCKKQLVYGLLPKFVGFLDSHPLAASHELKLHKHMAIPNVNSRRFGDTRRFVSTHPEYTETYAEEHAKLNLALYASYRDRSGILGEHSTFLAAFNSFVTSCTPFTSQLMLHDLNDHICKRLNSNPIDGRGFDEDDELDTLVSQFRTAQGEEYDEEFDGEFMDLQRNMGPLVNTVTDAMVTSMNSSHSQVRTTRSCIVCSHIIRWDSPQSEHELMHGPPDHWEDCLMRPHDMNGGLTQQYKVDLEGVQLPLAIRKRWESLLLFGHASCVRVNQSTNIAEFVHCCNTCTNELNRGTLPQFAIANNLQTCNSGNPCRGGLQPPPLEPHGNPPQVLPMCFEKIESAFDDIGNCPFEGVDVTVPIVITSKPLSSKPSVNVVSCEWKLNEKQHCAFVILCATLLRKHAQREVDTVENTTT